MKKFLKSTIILVVGGIITKVLSMFIRIITTRYIGDTGIGLYMMLLPTFNLFITITTLSFPTALSKVISENAKDNKKIVISTIMFSLIFNVIIIFLILIFAKFIANNLLHNNILYLPIVATAFTLPFITISSIIRGYLFGKEKMFPHVFSNFLEQIIRIILIIFILPLFNKNDLTTILCLLVLFNIASEIVSSIVMLMFIPKKIYFTKDDFKFSFSLLKDVFRISFFTTFSRIISSISLFLEPVIITFILIKLGYDNIFITSSYGVLSGYVFPLVSMPAFLSQAISQVMLPMISKYYKAKKIVYIKNKIYFSVFLSLLIGIMASSLFFFFPSFFLNTLFNTSSGVSSLRLASVCFIISYVIGPNTAIMQACDKSFLVMIYTIIGFIIKTIVLIILLFLDMGIDSLIFSYLACFVFIFIFQIFIIKKIL